MVAGGCWPLVAIEGAGGWYVPHLERQILVQRKSGPFLNAAKFWYKMPHTHAQQAYCGVLDLSPPLQKTIGTEGTQMMQIQLSNHESNKALFSRRNRYLVLCPSFTITQSQGGLVSCAGHSVGSYCNASKWSDCEVQSIAKGMAPMESMLGLIAE